MISRLRPLVVGSFGTDFVAPKRDRAREGVRKLDLVMLAVTINVNDGPFTVFGQDTVLALDGMPESHHGEFRNLECIVHHSANPLLADFIGRGETKSMGEPAGRCVRISTRRDQANALTRIQEGRLEDRSSIPQALNFPSTWPPPALFGRPHQRQFFADRSCGYFVFDGTHCVGDSVFSENSTPERTVILLGNRVVCAIALTYQTRQGLS